MRRIVLASTALSVAVAFGVSGVAHAIDGTQKLEVKVKQTQAGSKSDPRSVGTLKIRPFIEFPPVVPGAPIVDFATTQAIIYFDKNLVFGGSKFKSCSAAQVAQDATKCPKGSKVSSAGSAKGTALQRTQQQSLTVTAYNASAGKGINLKVVGTTPLQINSVIEGKLRNSSGKYGKKLVVPIPDNLQRPSGVLATLTELSATVGGRGSGDTPFIGLKGCSGGKLNFKGDFTFTDGTKQTATTTVNCRKA
jgi:hypothetical protein